MYDTQHKSKCFSRALLLSPYYYFSHCLHLSVSNSFCFSFFSRSLFISHLVSISFSISLAFSLFQALFFSILLSLSSPSFSLAIYLSLFLTLWFSHFSSLSLHLSLSFYLSVSIYLSFFPSLSIYIFMYVCVCMCAFNCSGSLVKWLFTSNLAKIHVQLPTPLDVNFAVKRDSHESVDLIILFKNMTWVHS